MHFVPVLEQSVGLQSVELCDRFAHCGARKMYRIHERSPFDVGIVGSQTEHTVLDRGEVCPNGVAHRVVVVLILQRNLQATVAHLACILERRFADSRLSGNGNTQQHVACHLVEELYCAAELAVEEAKVETDVRCRGLFPLQFRVACAVEAEARCKGSAEQIVGTGGGKCGIRIGIDTAFVTDLSPT